jgi:hypothetical protein
MKYARLVKKWLILLWLLVPVGLLSYHFGPGQRELAWTEAAAARADAVSLEKQGQWQQAVEAYGKAMMAVPTFADDASSAAVARDQLRLAQIRAGFQLGKLNDTLADLRQFIEQVEATHGPGSALEYDARDLLGRVHYGAMIALRLESAEKPVWMQQWELSRQNFRYLAEHTTPSRNGLDRKNLEVVIKSADMPVPPVPPPPAGGGGGAAPPTFTPPPPSANNATTTTAPPDNRPRAPTLNNSEVTPPEFELGS